MGEVPLFTLLTLLTLGPLKPEPGPGYSKAWEKVCYCVLLANRKQWKNQSDSRRTRLSVKYCALLQSVSHFSQFLPLLESLPLFSLGSLPRVHSFSAPGFLPPFPTFSRGAGGGVLSRFHETSVKFTKVAKKIWSQCSEIQLWTQL